MKGGDEDVAVTRGTYKCPLCEFENPNRMNTARHYGIRHRFVHRMYEDILCKPVFGANNPPPQFGRMMDRRFSRNRQPTMVGGVVQQQPVVTKCKICQVEQDTGSSYQRHLIKVHFKSRLLSDLPRSKPFFCPNEGCDVERRDRFNLLMHYGSCQRKVWKVMEEMPAGSVETLDDTSKSKCRLCGKYFTSPRYMWTHMGEDHFAAELDAELPTKEPWKCPKCPQEGAYVATELRSLRTHYGTRHKAVMPHLAKKLNIPLEKLKMEFGDIVKECLTSRKVEEVEDIVDVVQMSPE